MPGFTTHYLFGVEAYKRIESKKIRQLIRKNHSAFSLGLQGPDVFFYYLPSYFLHDTNLGALAHDTDTKAFFTNLMKSRSLFTEDSEKLAIADAYISGFIGHYTLDCTAHPYVYAFTSYEPTEAPKQTDYFGQHAYLETELDIQMLWMLKHMHPTKFHQDATIHLNKMEKKVIALMLTYAYHHTYDVYATPAIMKGAMHWMETGTRLVNDPSGQKKVMVRWVERLALDRPFISAMLPSDKYQFVVDPLNYTRRTWVHPWTKNESTETFVDLFEKAGALYDERLCSYFDFASKEMNDENTESFLKWHGNRSFLSGESL